MLGFSEAGTGTVSDPRRSLPASRTQSDPGPLAPRPDLPGHGACSRD